MIGEFRAKKYVALIQGSNMSAEWHSGNLILGKYCYRINSLGACL